MINEPSVDSMIRKLGTKEEPVSRYALCTVASKRARQIIEEERNAGIRDFAGRDKELLAACKDIDEGRVVIAKDYRQPHNSAPKKRRGAFACLSLPHGGITAENKELLKL